MQRGCFMGYITLTRVYFYTLPDNVPNLPDQT